MLVCHCNGVSDRAIRKAVRKGAKSVGEVGMMTGAATCCGGCANAVAKVVRAELGAARERTPRDVIVPLPVRSA